MTIHLWYKWPLALDPFIPCWQSPFKSKIIKIYNTKIPKSLISETIQIQFFQYRNWTAIGSLPLLIESKKKEPFDHLTIYLTNPDPFILDIDEGNLARKCSTSVCGKSIFESMYQNILCVISVVEINSIGGPHRRN